MDTKEAQVKILALAIYELRLLLSGHLGSTSKGDASEVISARLAYALHSEALAIIENRPDDFDIDKSLEKIKKIDERYGELFQNLVGDSKE